MRQPPVFDPASFPEFTPHEAPVVLAILGGSAVFGGYGLAAQASVPIDRLSFLGAMIEVMQAIPTPHRQCDVLDWMADTMAVLVVTGLAALVVRRGPGFALNTDEP